MNLDGALGGKPLAAVVAHVRLGDGVAQYVVVQQPFLLEAGNEVERV